ncbi:MAG: hypothetical protein QOE70_3827 [Chthoniobacter sp.]|jgi:hypothetical protein|nr:hypothetical protein [Chthoniobacter sp.]
MESRVRIFTIALLLAHSAFATSWVRPKFPPAPPTQVLLTENGLADGNEKKFLEYVDKNSSSISTWLPYVSQAEEEAIANEYFRRLNAGVPGTDAFLKERTADLTQQRLRDPRRIVDAVLRELGEKGSAQSLIRLLPIAKYLEQPWAKWKVYASVQRILEREQPSSLTVIELRAIELDVVAPLLRDLPEERAQVWAWALWENWYKWLAPFLESRVSLSGRLWLARFFAGQHPEVAVKIFRDGLGSSDGAIRTLAEMLLRQGIGRSLPHATSGKSLVERMEAGEWKPTTALWEIMPQPLSGAFPVGGRGSGKHLGRVDLVWFDRSAKIVNRTNDVWPMAKEILPNGLFYCKVGDLYPLTCVLTNSEGQVYTRFFHLNGMGVVVSHGGLLCLVGSRNNVTEFAPDGTVLWESPPTSAFRMVAPYTAGRALLLGYHSLECCNRRGDILWKTDLKDLDDPRYIVPTNESKFLLSCGKSFGWLTENGTYSPLLGGLGSTGWIKYHPTAEWIVFDGASWKVLIYDVAGAAVTGHFDLDDGGEKEISRFASESRYPE